jgi:hypothetical protein
MEEYKVSKKTIDSFYLKNYKTTKELEFGDKSTIESIWKVGGMPIVHIVNSKKRKIEAHNCFADFDNYVLAAIGENNGFKDIDSEKLSKVDKSILGKQLNKLDKIKNFDFVIFYYWSYFLEQKMIKDTVEGLLYKTFNSGQRIIDSLNANDKVYLIPINVDFLSEEWEDKEIRKVFKSLMEK